MSACFVLACMSKNILHSRMIFIYLLYYIFNISILVVKNNRYEALLSFKKSVSGTIYATQIQKPKEKQRPGGYSLVEALTLEMKAEKDLTRRVPMDDMQLIATFYCTSATCRLKRAS
jgi:hypothetical protein